MRPGLYTVKATSTIFLQHSEDRLVKTCLYVTSVMIVRWRHIAILPSPVRALKASGGKFTDQGTIVVVSVDTKKSIINWYFDLASAHGRLTPFDVYDARVAKYYVHESRSRSFHGNS